MNKLLNGVKNMLDSGVQEDIAWQSAVVNYLDAITRCLYVLAAENEVGVYDDKYASKCCGAWVWVRGEGITKWHECSQCGEPCDLK